ncbi:hypothetical protein C8Q75DRAFT_734430 [Abortiporus biennis]|nr:hypothetical protein C8Q75DRAFT_734430 [Abortiporus biennis]
MENDQFFLELNVEALKLKFYYRRCTLTHVQQESPTNAAHTLSTPKLQSSSSSMPPLTLPPQVQVSIIDPLDSFNRVHLTRIQYWNVTLNAKEVKSSNQRHVTLVFHRYTLVLVDPRPNLSAHHQSQTCTFLPVDPQIEFKVKHSKSRCFTFEWIAQCGSRFDYTYLSHHNMFNHHSGFYNTVDSYSCNRDCDRASRATQYQMKHGSLESENSCCGCLKVVAETTPHFLLIRSCIISSAFPLDHINHCEYESLTSSIGLDTTPYGRTFSMAVGIRHSDGQDEDELHDGSSKTIPGYPHTQTSFPRLDECILTWVWFGFDELVYILFSSLNTPETMRRVLQISLEAPPKKLGMDLGINILYPVMVHPWSEEVLNLSHSFITSEKFSTLKENPADVQRLRAEQRPRQDSEEKLLIVWLFHLSSMPVNVDSLIMSSFDGKLLTELSLLNKVPLDVDYLWYNRESSELSLEKQYQFFRECCTHGLSFAELSDGLSIARKLSSFYLKERKGDSSCVSLSGNIAVDICVFTLLRQNSGYTA